MDILSKFKNINLPIPTKIKVKLDKHTPDILIGTGIVLVIGGAVYACKKTLTAHEALEDAEARLKDIKYGEDKADGHPDFDAKAARGERIKVYRETGFELAKCYGPSVVAGVVGIGLILKGHGIEKDRNVALTGAYAGLLANYQAYREKIKAEIGEDKERDIYSGATRETVEYTDENGKTKKDKNAAVFHDDGSGHSPYSRIFDPVNKNWSPNPGDNFRFLKLQQSFANDKLRAEGVVFLNDVYQMLGYPRSTEGQIVGWIWDPDVNHEGDDVIDFGIFDKAYKSQVVRDFINGYEPCIWLDFNVDGVVYDLL
jgi:hypothetical protein